MELNLYCSFNTYGALQSILLIVMILMITLKYKKDYIAKLSMVINAKEIMDLIAIKLMGIYAQQVIELT